MSKACITVILILMIPVCAQAQDETWSNEDDLDYYLTPDIWLEEELWELESDPLLFEPFWEYMIELCDILLELDLDLEITDEEMYGVFPEPWELDCEFFWYEEW